ncbi:MAG TPA: hypothetical protein VNK04_07915 [Gemmataceae bacterium]|nr:hypothetical protein [Gemmataceae bacterium]
MAGMERAAERVAKDGQARGQTPDYLVEVAGGLSAVQPRLRSTPAEQNPINQRWRLFPLNSGEYDFPCG